MHKHYCEIDLRNKMMFVCILNNQGEFVLHKNIKAIPEPFFKLTADYKENLVIGRECVFSWYCLADECEKRGKGNHSDLGEGFYWITS